MKNDKDRLKACLNRIGIEMFDNSSLNIVIESVNKIVFFPFYWVYKTISNVSSVVIADMNSIRENKQLLSSSLCFISIKCFECRHRANTVHFLISNLNRYPELCIQ